MKLSLDSTPFTQDAAKPETSCTSCFQKGKLLLSKKEQGSRQQTGEYITLPKYKSLARSDITVLLPPKKKRLLATYCAQRVLPSFRQLDMSTLAPPPV